MCVCVWGGGVGRGGRKVDERRHILQIHLWVRGKKYVTVCNALSRKLKLSVLIFTQYNTPSIPYQIGSEMFHV